MSEDHLPVLRIDDKWSIRYDPTNNDRPVRWLRYGEPTGVVCNEWDENNAVTAMFYAMLEAQEAPGEVAKLKHTIDRDRYIVAAGTTAINRAISSRMWLFEGRGPYEWDDDDFRKEFADALETIEDAMEPLKRVAWDKTDCDNFEERVVAARQAALDELKRPIGPRDMIAADIGLVDPRDAEIARLRNELAKVYQLR